LATLEPDPSGLTSTGPWLVYSPVDYFQFNDTRMATSLENHQLYVVNADGSGRTSVSVNVYDPEQAGSLADKSNRLAILDRLIYVVRPEGGQATFIAEVTDYRRETEFIGSSSAGFLASVHGRGPGVFPELIVHQLPSGQIQDRIPLARCPEEAPQCLVEIYSRSLTLDGDAVGGYQQIAWSPDGRYLAYAAIGEGFSPDLYLYDSSGGSTRQMTDGPSYIGKIFWSPDGRWILFESIPPFEEGVSEYQEALWAIALDGSRARKLYVSELLGPGQGIAGWLDSERFISHDGVWEIDFLRHARLVNLGSGEVKTLLPGEFRHLTFDPNTGAVIVFLPGEDGGWFHFTTQDLKLRPMQQAFGSINWDVDLQMFVASDQRCESGEEGIWTVTSSGESRCLPRQPEIYPSPDGRWQVVAEGEIRLQTTDGETVQRLAELETGQVIWRPDSEGFFLATDRTLYHVSVPDLSMEVVDNQIRSSSIPLQWLDTDD
jgi:hypothetical protein